MTEHRVVELDATPKNRVDRTKEIVERYEQYGHQLVETIEVSGHTVGLVFAREEGDNPKK